MARQIPLLLSRDQKLKAAGHVSRTLQKPWHRSSKRQRMARANSPKYRGWALPLMAPSRTCRDVRFHAAIGGRADIRFYEYTAYCRIIAGGVETVLRVRFRRTRRPRGHAAARHRHLQARPRSSLGRDPHRVGKRLAHLGRLARAVAEALEPRVEQRVVGKFRERDAFGRRLPGDVR